MTDPLEERRGIERNETEKALQKGLDSGILTQEQASLLNRMIFTTDDLGLGKQILLHKLVSELAVESDLLRFNDKIRLLKRYIGSIKELTDLVEVFERVFAQKKQLENQSKNDD